MNFYRLLTSKRDSLFDKEHEECVKAREDSRDIDAAVAYTERYLDEIGKRHIDFVDFSYFLTSGIMFRSSKIFGSVVRYLLNWLTIVVVVSVVLRISVLVLEGVFS